MKFPILLALRLYQTLVSPWMPDVCRYRPTCSQYMMEAVRRHGALVGVWLGIKRLIRCAPWGGHGYDPVP